MPAAFERASTIALVPMLQRRSLPIASCPLATAVQPVGDGVGWCEHCRLHVHDLSAGTELEARTLLRAHGRGRLCIAYSTRADGSVAFREQARRWAGASVIALLVACTGHAPTDVAPELVCRDAEGREQLCPAPPEPTPAVQTVRPSAKAPIEPDVAPREDFGGAFFVGFAGSDDEDVWGELTAPETKSVVPERPRSSRRARRARR